MGGVCSTCCGQRRKNNYEPLLLENEREAVADLLQYLESECDLRLFELLLVFGTDTARPEHDQLLPGLSSGCSHYLVLLR